MKERKIVLTESSTDRSRDKTPRAYCTDRTERGAKKITQPVKSAVVPKTSSTTASTTTATISVTATIPTTATVTLATDATTFSFSETRMRSTLEWNRKLHLIVTRPEPATRLITRWTLDHIVDRTARALPVVIVLKTTKTGEPGATVLPCVHATLDQHRIPVDRDRSIDEDKMQGNATTTSLRLVDTKI